MEPVLFWFAWLTIGYISVRFGSYFWGPPPLSLGLILILSGMVTPVLIGMMMCLNNVAASGVKVNTQSLDAISEFLFGKAKK